MSEEPRIYFAYGSNMSVPRLQVRVPSAKSLGVGTLDDHQLMFRKKSKKDRSAKCDIAPSGGCTVLGVLFEIDPGEKQALDGAEALGKGYKKKCVDVSDAAGRHVRAFTYYADSEHIQTTLRPYTWYVKHVLAGAEEAGLPERYIDNLKRVEAVVDPDPDREKKELAIYGSR